MALFNENELNSNADYLLDEVRKQKEKIRKLKEELQMWKDTAEQWMREYDKLCEKYEPVVVEPQKTKKRKK
jgi:hypothetical protein